MIRTKEIQTPVLQRSGERPFPGEADRKLWKDRDTTGICGIHLDEKGQEQKGQREEGTIAAKERAPPPVTKGN